MEHTDGAPGPGLPCLCLTVAGLQEALEAVAAVEALLPAGSGLLLELGTLQARWLNDVLALGEFLRAAREAHEVLRFFGAAAPHALAAAAAAASSSDLSYQELPPEEPEAAGRAPSAPRAPRGSLGARASGGAGVRPR
jgi:hypothetical protein